MSTLKVNTIQDASGGNSSTASQISQGRAKAWMNYNHKTDTIRDSFNVSSVSDYATGECKMIFATAMPSLNYAAVASCGEGATNIGDADIASVTHFETTQVEIQTIGTPDVPSGESDMEFLCVVIFGD